MSQHGFGNTPAEAHSMGWVLQEGDVQDDPRTIPNLNRPPPKSKAECDKYKKALGRVAQFYDEGEDNQTFELQRIDIEKRDFGLALQRIKRQMESLDKHPADHPTKTFWQKRLQREDRVVSIRLNALDRKQKETQLLFQKRIDIAKTMHYMNFLLDKHCEQFEEPEEIPTPQTNTNNK
eukprot:TRINITY_DN5418_c0_g1_i1.p1 TRINITY_DN5418_c0_g1~~TRINITY_DN5418_c0_g1_i1.p1  ORF type:complete len:178 (+),score=45.34 TRINITY_DN5418_c0_g1_i1:48-581(+)